jgi:hypothetical protein
MTVQVFQNCCANAHSQQNSTFTHQQRMRHRFRQARLPLRSAECCQLARRAVITPPVHVLARGLSTKHNFSEANAQQHSQSATAHAALHKDKSHNVGSDAQI